MEKEIEQFISYAVKEGFIDADLAESWTEEEKEKYYNKCLAQE